MEEVEEMEEELTDRFGQLPRSVINLLDIARMRMMAKQVYISDIKEESRSIKFSVYEKAKYDPVRIAPFIQGYKGAMILRTGARPYFLYTYAKGRTYEGEGLIHLIEDLLASMRVLVEA